MPATVRRATCRNLAIALQQWLASRRGVRDPRPGRGACGRSRASARRAQAARAAGDPAAERERAGLARPADRRALGRRPPPSAAHSLDSYVSRLRRVLGADRIVRRAPGYLVVVEPDELDLERFERARRGAGIAARGAGAVARAGARRRALRAVRQRGGRAARAAAPARARGADRRRPRARRGRELVPELDALVREHPLRERLLGQLMLALYRAGRQADALAAMQAARHRLASELGIEPGPELRELEQPDPATTRGLAAAGRSPRLPAHRRGRRAARRRRLAVAAVAGAALLIAVRRRLAAGGRAQSRANRAVAIDAGERAAAALGRAPRGSRPPRSPRTGRCGSPIPTTSSCRGSIHRRARSSTGSRSTGSPGARAGAGSIWVASTLGGAVTRIDPATGHVTQTVPVGAPIPGAIAYRAGEVWVADTARTARSSSSTRASGAVKATHALELRPTAIAVGAGDVWVADHDDGVVAQVEPRRAARCRPCASATGRLRWRRRTARSGSRTASTRRSRGSIRGRGAVGHDRRRERSRRARRGGAVALGREPVRRDRHPHRRRRRTASRARSASAGSRRRSRWRAGACGRQPGRARRRTAAAR